MWEMKLDKEGKDQGKVYRILMDEDLSVGRKDCEIRVPDDPSVSRKHATIHTSHVMSNLSNLKMRPICLLKDCMSKYGSFVNGVKVSKQGVVLRHGDLVTFGQCGSNFCVSYKPLVVTTSCLEVSDKTSVKEFVRKLGGHVVEEWDTECTHLVMTGIKVTVKAVCALVSQKPLVLPEYFKKYLELCQCQKEPEDPKNFLPPVKEQLLKQVHSDFHLNSSRSEIFKNMTFIFLSPRQYLKLRLPIILGEGTAKLLNQDDVKPEILRSSCVISYTPERNSSNSQTCTQKQINEVTTLLERFKKRFIPESDIGLAVVHCSTEQYCNPDFVDEAVSGSILFPDQSFNLQSQTLSQNIIYGPETDCPITSHQQPSGTYSSNIVTTVMETESPSSQNLEPVKPKLSNECILESAASKRRNHELSDSDEEPPSKFSKSESLFAEKQTTPLSVAVKLEPGSPLSPILHSQDSPDGSLHCLDGAFEMPTTSTAFSKEATQSDNYRQPGHKQKSQFEKIEENQPSKKQKLTSEAASVSIVNESENPMDEQFATSRDSIVKPLNSKNLTNSSKMTGESVSVKEEVKSEDMDIPKMHTEMVNLVVLRNLRISNPPQSNNTFDPTIKNFKKFKKSLHVGANKLPRIIGGCDLEAYSKKDNFSELNNWDPDQESENTQPNLEGNTSFSAAIRKQRTK